MAPNTTHTGPTTKEARGHGVSGNWSNGTGSLLVGLSLRSGGTSPRLLPDRIQTAEAAGLNFLVFGARDPESPTEHELLSAVEVAAYATALTSAIGLVAAIPTTHAEPFHVSNQLSSLDRGSNGRAGWLATIDVSTSWAQAFSTSAPDIRTAQREAAAIIDTTRRLWDSWEDGALIADARSGRFLDADKIHYIDGTGEFFDIRGPALMPRPVQGQPPVFAPVDLGSAGVDVALVSAGTELELIGAAERARSAGTARVLAEIVVSDSSESAIRGEQRLHCSSDDSTIPALLDRLRRHVDGVVLYPTEPDAQLPSLLRDVAPALEAAGLLRRPRPGLTLREQFGLPRPRSRYAATHLQETGASR
ncbi:UNVERIFIED_CONTAM: alkanesulfonate monooxygenase SsuD/methylene tetrahydromethanopterin reductase-like flavin-dependent oxidoreductase (luciferase family) [Williamsia faeni]